MNTRAAERILVIANETVTSPLVREVIRKRVSDAGRAEVAVVAPALNSRFRHWLSDSDEASRKADERLRGCLGALADDGLRIRGWIGDADPLQAIDDALHFFAADLLVIATHPEDRSNWLARALVERARTRYRLPIVHIVVDHAIEEEYALQRASAA
jgi:GABA permease